MKTQILEQEMEVELTSDSASSSYGIRVLRVNGNAYGPMDTVAGTFLKAGDVAVLAKFPGTLEFLKQEASAYSWWNLEAVAVYDTP